MFVVSNPTAAPLARTLNIPARDGVAYGRALGRRGEAPGFGVSSRTAAEPAAAPAAPASPSVGPSGPPGLKKLTETLASLGIGTAGVDLQYHEELVSHPGGSYLNRTISVTGNGITENFSADLVERSPVLAAFEMQKYFGLAGGAPITFIPF